MLPTIDYVAVFDMNEELLKTPVVLDQQQNEQEFQPLEDQSKFTIEGILGQGGMGTIYDAYDRNIRRKIAIKCISEERAQDQISRKYFTKEAQITGQLEHPNIIPVYEMGINPQGLFYYVMKNTINIWSEGFNYRFIMNWFYDIDLLLVTPKLFSTGKASIVI